MQKNIIPRRLLRLIGIGCFTQHLQNYRGRGSDQGRREQHKHHRTNDDFFHVCASFTSTASTVAPSASAMIRANAQARRSRLTGTHTVASGSGVFNNHLYKLPVFEGIPGIGFDGLSVDQCRLDIQ